MKMMIKPSLKRSLPIIVFLSGLLALLLGHMLTITVSLNGEILNKPVFALTTNQAVDQLGIQVGKYDAIQPKQNRWLLFHPILKIEQAVTYALYTDLQSAPMIVISPDKIPGNLYAAINQPLFPGDRVLLNGLDVDPNQRIPYQPYQTLQLIRGTTLVLDQGTGTSTFSSSQPTVGLALYERNLPIKATDYVGYPLQTNLQEVQHLGYFTAAPYTIQVDGSSIQVMAAAKTTGAALANAGISLQGLDYSIPAADQPLPASGTIQVIRVKEVINLSQTKIPYESTFVGNPELELDQRKITKAGQYGVKVARERIRYENGVESARSTEAEWTAAEPVTEEVSYGQKVVINTLSTPNGTIEYWRAVTVYATAYSPCRSAADRCYFGTSLGLPVKQGVIGVTRAWYADLAGQAVYVPGYGTAVIADVGGGIPGKRWIDLGYTDDEFERMAVGVWPQTVTMYFLTPVPEVIPWILP
jgi:uncharacterized protein YabE (DUF348 family)